MQQFPWFHCNRVFHGTWRCSGGGIEESSMVCKKASPCRTWQSEARVKKDELCDIFAISKFVFLRGKGSRWNEEFQTVLAVSFNDPLHMVTFISRGFEENEDG